MDRIPLSLLQSSSWVCVQISPADKESLYQSLWGRSCTDSFRDTQFSFTLKHHTHIMFSNVSTHTSSCWSQTDIVSLWLVSLPQKVSLWTKFKAMMINSVFVCVFYSREGNIPGQGLAQALSEMWEVQQDADARLTRIGETPGKQTMHSSLSCNLC